MTKEALKLALEALESCDCGDYSTGHVIYPSFNVDAVNKAIDAIDDVLAQPWEKFCDSNCVWTDHHPDCKLEQTEQEPVAWVHIQGNYRVPRFWELNDDEIKRGWEQHPLYTTPPQRKPLMWISTADQMPPLGVRVFWMDQDSNRVGYDTWMGNNFRFTPSHWMHIPAIEAAHGIKGEA